MAAQSKDHVVRAMTMDGAFRVLAIVMQNTLAETGRRQNIKGDTLSRMGELLAGTVLLRETIQPSRRVQVIIKDQQGGRIVADSKPDGSNRGLVNPGSTEPVDTKGDGILQVNYTLKNSELHQGIVSIPAGSSISEAFMRYMQESEQIVCVLDVQVRNTDNENDGPLAIGFVVQLTPESERDQVEEMTKLLDGYDGMDRALASSGTFDPNTLIEEILVGREYSILADSDLKFGCSCSRVRMSIGLKSLPNKDLGELLADQEPVECKCDACGEAYVFSTDEIAEMLIEKTPLDGLQN